MSETPTPETDAARMKGYGEFGGDWVLLERNCYEKHPEGDVIFSEVAERLERERDEAREELARLRKGLVRLIRRWKRREKEYLNAVTPAFEMGDKCAGNRYYGESIGTQWAIEDLEILAKRKEEAK